MDWPSLKLGYDDAVLHWPEAMKLNAGNPKSGCPVLHGVCDPRLFGRQPVHKARLSNVGGLGSCKERRLASFPKIS